MKPRGKLSTSARCQQAREWLGLTKTDLARILRLGKSGVEGRETVRRIEAGQTPPGPYQLALEALVAGWRPWGVKLPVDKPNPRSDLAAQAEEALGRLDGGRVHRTDTQRDFNTVWDALEALKGS